MQQAVVGRETAESQRVHGGEQRHKTTYPKHYSISASKYLPPRKRGPRPLLTSVGVDGAHDTVVLCSCRLFFCALPIRRPQNLPS